MPCRPPVPLSERILIVDDVEANLAVLASALEPAGYEILAVADGLKALSIAAKARPDLILLDVMMPGMDGLETCRRLREEQSTRAIPVIFITARTELSCVVEGFRVGGVDYIVKPFQTEEVLSRVATHLRSQRLTRELQEQNRMLELRTAELTAEIERRKQAETALQDADQRLAALSDLEADRWNLSGLLGQSLPMRQLLGDIRRVNAFSSTTVLITGESGTGKELIAKAIHFGGARARAPFVPVNCVAIPADLAESMLFGHVKGAFTGATADRKGYFELAYGGTLFLDEIGDMPAALQVKLLRVLEDGVVTPVGGSEPRRVDVRIVAATNADLEARIADGSFRQDLYFRLARFQVGTTPLRERVEDVPPLAAHFLQRFAAEMGLKPPRLTPPAVASLTSYDFPGNVRELRNIVERALIQSGGADIQPEHIHLLRRGKAPRKESLPPAEPALGALPLKLAEVEDLLIQRALQQTGGNIADAARLLGIHRTRIYRRMVQEKPASE